MNIHFICGSNRCVHVQVVYIGLMESEARKYGKYIGFYSSSCAAAVKRKPNMTRILFTKWLRTIRLLKMKEKSKATLSWKSVRANLKLSLRVERRQWRISNKQTGARILDIDSKP